MIYLTVINTIAIIYILTHKQFSIHKNETFSNNTLLGYGLYYKNKRRLYTPIRNARRTELNEEVHRMINDTVNKHYTIRAKFSWIKTITDAEQFRKDYEVVDRKLVNELVDNFKLEHQQ